MLTEIFKHIHYGSIDEFIDILNNYLIWYNEKRIKISLGGCSPMECRHSLGLKL
ncbi:MAG: IS3 family transposase [Bacilli bacterium]